MSDERTARLSLRVPALQRETGAQAREDVHDLVKEVRLNPEGGLLRIEVRGALAAMLALGQGVETPKARPEDLWTDFSNTYVMYRWMRGQDLNL
ncbi:hypothetical protein ACI6QG_11045 [Roseococcus sp. DSY-14]|uniref:hypothetical protein n=1 Tax=Roseococcus sp. DSY-14 TaxID=3369650 RepID=UPI00387B6257